MLNALRNHFNKKSNIDTTPNPISSKRLKTETSNIPPQSASGLSLSQTQLNTIINAIASPGVWDEQMSDMVPELIPGLPNWPAARGLVIHIPYGNEEEIVHRFHRHDEATHGLAKNVRTFDEDIHLYLENDHYSVFDKKSQRYLPIEKDGDCFYNAVLTACHRHNPREARALGKNAYALRQHMADYIRRQPDKVQLFVDQNQIHIDPPQHVPVIDSAFPNDITMRTPSPVPQSPLFLSRHANLDIPTEKLPTETWHQIAHYLDAPDISRLQQTNHAWKDFMQSDAIWLPRLTPAAQQSLKAQHKTETTNASTAFAKPSAYTQFIANPLTRRGLVFGNSRDYQQVVNTVSAHLTTLLKTHPHRLNIVALEEISPANVHNHAEENHDHLSLCKTAAHTIVQKSFPLADIENWITLSANQVPDTKLQAALSIGLDKISAAFPSLLTKLVTNPAISTERLQNVAYHLDQVHSLEPKIRTWITDAHGVSDTRLARILSTLAKTKNASLAHCIDTLHRDVYNPLISNERIAGLMRLSTQVPAALFAAYRQRWNALPGHDISFPPPTIPGLDALLHHGNAQHIPATYLDTVFEIAFNACADRAEFENVSTYCSTFRKIPPHLYPFFTQQFQDNPNNFTAERIHQIARVITVVPDANETLLTPLMHLPVAVAKQILTTPHWFNALTNPNIPPEKICSWFSQCHEKLFSQQRLYAISCGIAVDHVDINTLEAWLHDPHISDSALHALLVPADPSHPDAQRQKPSWLFSEHNRATLQTWLHDARLEKILPLLQLPAPNMSLMSYITFNRIDLAHVTPHLYTLDKGKIPLTIEALFNKSAALQPAPSQLPPSRKALFSATKNTHAKKEINNTLALMENNTDQVVPQSNPSIALSAECKRSIQAQATQQIQQSEAQRQKREDSFSYSSQHRENEYCYPSIARHHSVSSSGRTPAQAISPHNILTLDTRGRYTDSRPTNQQTHDSRPAIADKSTRLALGQ